MDRQGPPNQTRFQLTRGLNNEKDERRHSVWTGSKY